MDRLHSIEQQVERLDDHAFAVFLAWFDQYADRRWATGWSGAREGASVAEGGCAAITSVAWLARPFGAGRYGHPAACRPRLVAEPKASAWLSQVMNRE